jgi:hypothetical protein
MKQPNDYMNPNRPISVEEADSIANEALHAAFSLIAERLDAECRHDLGGFFGLYAEDLAQLIERKLATCSRLAVNHINQKTK